MFRQFLYAAFFAAFASTSSGQADRVDPSRVLGKALALKPKDETLEWKRIPWERSLQKARRAALRENRPLLLWGVDDDPLDRC